jgi:hypothetical protein
MDTAGYLCPIGQDCNKPDGNFMSIHTGSKYIVNNLQCNFLDPESDKIYDVFAVDYVLQVKYFSKMVTEAMSKILRKLRHVENLEEMTTSKIKRN